jgi:hypothetical protein
VLAAGIQTEVWAVDLPAVRQVVQRPAQVAAIQAVQITAARPVAQAARLAAALVEVPAEISVVGLALVLRAAQGAATVEPALAAQERVQGARQAAGTQAARLAALPRADLAAAPEEEPETMWAAVELDPAGRAVAAMVVPPVVLALAVPTQRTQWEAPWAIQKLGSQR